MATHRGPTALDSTGKPHITLYVGEHMGLQNGGPKQASHYRCTGKKWTSGGCPDLPVAVGDMLVSSPNKVSLLLGGKDDEDTGEVAWWHSVDGGESFRKGDVLISLKKTGLGITSMIRNAHPDARVMIVGKSGSGDIGKMYLLGDHGPVKRPQAEADLLGKCGRDGSMIRPPSYQYY